MKASFHFFLTANYTTNKNAKPINLGIILKEQTCFVIRRPNLFKDIDQKTNLE
jgi:hypothetical protein